MKSDVRDIRDAPNGNTIHSAQLEKVKKSQGNQLKRWFFTYNNYNKQDIKILETCLQLICEEYIFQEEMGEQGTPHLQGVIFLKKKMRWTEFGLPTSIHWEPVKNPIKAKAYCEKEDTRNGDVFKWKSPELIQDELVRNVELEIVDALYPWQQSIYDMCKLKPNKRSIIWIYDPDGNNGKTELCKFLTIKVDAISATSGSAKDIACILANCVKNGKNLNGLTTFIFHYSRTSEHISYKAIESVKDGYITSTKYESGTLVFNNPHTLIFSNELPEIDKLTKDRWIIYTIKEKSLVQLSLDEVRQIKENEFVKDN